MSTATIVLPTGVSPIIDIKSPATEQKTEITAEQTVTDLKLLKILMALSAGKITSAEIKSEPTRFIARTIIIAMIMAMTRL